MPKQSEGFKKKQLSDFATFAVESMSDGAFLIAKDARILYVNQAACRQLGYTERELLELTIFDINPTLTREIWDAVRGVTVKDKTQIMETVHITKDGREFPVEISANYIEFDGEQYSCSFSRDITYRKEMETRIQQSEKMEAIGQLAGGIAHDFNNQLSGILACADLLKMELADKPDLIQFVDNIITSGKRSAGLTAQLLAFSRQGKYLSVPVDVHALIDETVQILKRSVNKNIKIVTKLEAENAHTTGDPSQLENAFLNLAINARDAMPSGGELLFCTQNVDLDESSHLESMSGKVQPGKYIQIRVIDTGTGMSKKVLNRIFEPFFTTKEVGKGTGMGLASVYGTTKNHKGTVEVHSKLGKGTEVTLYLPSSALLDPVTTDSATESEIYGNIAAKVVVIDDEPVVLDAIKKILESFGCQVTTCETGNEAIELYKTSYKDFDVVILDLIMPGMSGKEIFNQMRAINPGVIAIVASGYSLEDEVRDILGAGAKAFLAKPFQADELAKTLVRLLALNR